MCFLYSIRRVICSVFTNKRNNWWCFCLFLLVLRKNKQLDLRKDVPGVKFSKTETMFIRHINENY